MFSSDQNTDFQEQSERPGTAGHTAYYFRQMAKLMVSWGAAACLMKGCIGEVTRDSRPVKDKGPEIEITSAPIVK